MSSHKRLHHWLKNSHVWIDMDGTLKSIHLQQLKPMIVVFAMLTYLQDAIKNIKIIPFTLLATTHYASFIEQVLILNQQSYFKIYKPYIVDNLYLTSNQKKSISLHPLLKDFNDQIVDLTPLSDEELTKVSQFFPKITHWQEAQNKVLDLLPDINAHHIIRQRYIDNDDYQFSTQSNVTHITQVGEKLYKITTPTTIHYTHSVLTDCAPILQPIDVVNKLYFNTQTNAIVHDEKYIVNNHLQLESLRSKLIEEDMIALPFYNLKNPRNTNTDSFFNLHPFCFPATSDLILTILVMTQAIIDAL